MNDSNTKMVHVTAGMAGLIKHLPFDLKFRNDAEYEALVSLRDKTAGATGDLDIEATQAERNLLRRIVKAAG